MSPLLNTCLTVSEVEHLLSFRAVFHFSFTLTLNGPYYKYFKYSSSNTSSVFLMFIRAFDSLTRNSTLQTS